MHRAVRRVHRHSLSKPRARAVAGDDHRFCDGWHVFCVFSRRTREFATTPAGQVAGANETILLRVTSGRAGALPDRKSVVEGRSVSVRVDLGGRRIITKNKIRDTSDMTHTA